MKPYAAIAIQSQAEKANQGHGRPNAVIHPQYLLDKTVAAFILVVFKSRYAVFND